MTRRTFDSVAVGDTLETVTVPVTRATLVQYAGASLDRNPIHWDERFATSVGLPDVIAHGMLTMGAAATFVADWAGDAGAVREIGTRFTKPVVVPHDGGAEVVYAGTVKSLDDQARTAVVEITATCGEDKVLGRCSATVALG